MLCVLGQDGYSTTKSQSKEGDLKWHITTKGLSSQKVLQRTNFPYWAEEVTSITGACDGAEQVPVSRIHRVGFTLLTKFQGLIFARKNVFFSPAQICRVQGQREPNVVSNLIPLYHRHHIFLAKPCSKPSLNWCSMPLAHSSHLEQLSAYQRKISLQIPKPVEKSPNFATDKQDNACPETRNLLRWIALENGALCSNFIKKVFGKMVSASQSSLLSGIDMELCML